MQHRTGNRHQREGAPRTAHGGLAAVCLVFALLAAAAMAGPRAALAQDASTGEAPAASAPKEAAADRLLAANNPKDVMSDMARKIAGQLPADKRDRYVDLMTSDDLVSRLRDKSKSAMMKHFTADEMNALADFYEKPIARSAMKKMGTYMADLLPFIQAETMRVVRELNRSRPSGNQPPR
jgi:hypothetical protein